MVFVEFLHQQQEAKMDKIWIFKIIENILQKNLEILFINACQYSFSARFHFFNL